MNVTQSTAASTANFEPSISNWSITSTLWLPGGTPLHSDHCSQIIRKTLISPWHHDTPLSHHRTRELALSQSHPGVLSFEDPLWILVPRLTFTFSQVAPAPSPTLGAIRTFSLTGQLWVLARGMMDGRDHLQSCDKCPLSLTGSLWNPLILLEGEVPFFAVITVLNFNIQY